MTTDSTTQQHEQDGQTTDDNLRPLEERPDDHSEWSTEELEQRYDELVDEAADLGIQRKSFAPVVMDTDISEIKRELSNRA